MEKESTPNAVSDSEFLNLLKLAKQGDEVATLQLIRFFEMDILHLARFIRLPIEDAQQSIITEMIELFRTNILE